MKLTRPVIVISILLIFLSLFSGNVLGKKDKDSSKSIKIKSTIITAEYKTLADCLNSIKNETGCNLQNIITDEPTQISGFLSNGEHFACIEKVTDEKGNYVDGWYTVQQLTKE